MNEDLREQIAVFRYGVIRDLVSGPLAPGEKERLLAAIADRQWQIPGSRRGRIARSTAREWAEAYEAAGFVGLKPVDRSDKGSSRVIPDEVQDLLLALRTERPKASVRSLIRAVRLAGRVAPEVKLAPSTVYRLLAAHGMKVVPGASSGSPDAQAFSFPHANDLWVADVMHGPPLLVLGRGARSAKTYLIALLDDATRMAPYAAFYPSESAACFAEALKQALLRRGIPRRLYVDNGSAFRTHHLQVACATLNVALIHSRPHRPRGRGKIERFFRTVRSAFLPHVDATMLAEMASLNRVFWAWLEAEYHQTPHGGLSGQTPLERFLSDQALIRPAPSDLDDMLRMKVVRVVGRDRTVRLDGRVYEAPDGLSGEHVEVLFDPFDPRRPVRFRLRGENEERPLRRLDLAVNATLPRLRPDEDEQPAAEAPKTGISYLELLAERFFSSDEPREKS
jgi:transposase InsO family protein